MCWICVIFKEELHAHQEANRLLSVRRGVVQLCQRGRTDDGFLL